MATEEGKFRPVVTDDRDAAIKSLTGGFAEVFGFASDIFTNRPAFINSTDNRSPLAEAVRSISQYNCRRWGAADKANFSSNVNLGNSELCSPYLDRIGELPPPGDLGQAFDGGHCAGTVYAVSLGATFTDYLDGVELATGTMPLTAIGGVVFSGPITGVSKQPRSMGTTGLPQAWSIFVNHGNNSTRGLNVDPTDRAPVGGRTERRLNSFQAKFARVGGNPDTCAAPPDQIKPPGYNPHPSVPPYIEVNIPGLGPTRVTVTPGADGLPTICIVNLDICIDPDLGSPGPPVTPGSPAPAGPPAAGTSGTTGDGGDEEGEAPPGKELWALRLDINAVPPRANEYAPGVYRGVCYVYMGDDNGLDHDPAGAMVKSGQLVLAERDGLTKYRVTANMGYNLTVTPFWRTPEDKV